MSVLVLSCGRTGTNATVALLAGNSQLKQDPQIENKTIFRTIRNYQDNYLAKSDVTYLDNFKQFKALMDKNPNMVVVWTIRDPRDVIMSKIRRGQPSNKGGDNKGNITAADASPTGAKNSINKMFENYQKVKEIYPNRTLLVKMEDIVLEPTETSKKLCEQLSIEYDENMVEFPKRMKNEWKIRRYGREIDKKQVSLWENWKEVYNAFFVENKFDMEQHFNDVDHLVKYFNYG